MPSFYLEGMANVKSLHQVLSIAPSLTKTCDRWRFPTEA